jgi:uncharacterized protein YcgI (DUF1989 family)
MKLVEEIRVPARHGKAFKIKQGQILRLTQKAGAQIIDFNAWNADNPREMFWCGRTRIIENAHPTTGNKLWSVEPWMRTMFTIIADTADHTPSARGSYNHDLWYPRCNTGYHKLKYNVATERNCHNNLTAAIKEFGLGEEYVHDTLNAFMRTGLDPKTQEFFVETADAKDTDYMDLRAEMDCLVALSSCPGFTSPNIRDVIAEIYNP